MLTGRLNEDIRVIVSELRLLTDVPDVLSFNLICSALRPIALRRLLSMRPIPLYGDESVQEFHTFLFADPVTRAPHIRGLCIKSRKSSVQVPLHARRVASLLIEIVTSCP